MALYIVEKKRTFLEEVSEAAPGGEWLVPCWPCGSCGGACRSGVPIDNTSQHGRGGNP